MATIDTKAAQEIIQGIMNEYKKQWLNTLVTIVKGKYTGWTARIEGMLPDAKYGVVFLCMVQGKRRGNTLNSDSDTRTYRPADHFELIELPS